jgi:hypothetical protein
LIISLTFNSQINAREKAEGKQIPTLHPAANIFFAAE